MDRRIKGTLCIIAGLSLLYMFNFLEPFLLTIGVTILAIGAPFALAALFIGAALLNPITWLICTIVYICKRI